MDDMVKLDVGGCLYITSRSTLTRYTDSMLAAMFSSELDPSVRDANGAYVIDGDGPIFRHVLNFLRRGKLNLPEDFKEWDLLASEADFYQIEALVEAVKAEKCRRDTPGDAKETLEYIEIHASADVGYTYTGSRSTLRSIPKLLRFFRDYIKPAILREVDGPDRQITCTLALRPVQDSRSDSQARSVSTFEVRGTTNQTKLKEDFDYQKGSILREIEDLGFEMKTELYSFFPDDDIAKDIRWTFARRVGPGLKTNLPFLKTLFSTCQVASEYCSAELRNRRMDDIVKLDVGGCLYTTSRSTLTRYPDSMLAAMFSGELDPSVRDANGAYVMDRDGPIFRHVLNFLRQGKLILPEDFKEWDLLASEADFFQIPHLVAAVSSRKEVEDNPKMEYVEFTEQDNKSCKYRGSWETLEQLPREFLAVFEADYSFCRIRDMDDVIQLNVGGCLYTTTRSTMNRYPESMLCLMSKGELATPVPVVNGAYVLDRDGPIFRHVLNFYRHGKLILPKDFKEWELLASETSAIIGQFQCLCCSTMDEVINLNVGGSLYTTSLSTLTRYPDSMLGAMFSGRIQSARDAHGNYVIDGDGPLFRHVFNFLRRSTLTLPDDFREIDLLAAEADFYQIQELIQAVRCLREDREAHGEEARQQEERIPEMEYVEVEFECASGQWIVFGSAEVLKRIPVIQESFKDGHTFKNRLTRSEEYGLNLPRGQPVNRVRLFRETSRIGFGLMCTSSSGGDERSTDRWVFASSRGQRITAIKIELQASVEFESQSTIILEWSLVFKILFIIPNRGHVFIFEISQ
ncbi:uncharacterized protein LOC119725020 [Patiria miniata]|uniref:BTB domain-containing protein n=1 Tax=Patiria miniata TaxID=46514 RepID=A0A913ZKH2_PATMI|nr:uncharacterized protein LOC119725020 [Patiria miniata]